MSAQLLIGAVFQNAARAVPHRMAAALGPRSMTFAELDAAANRTARALARLGVGRGDRVVVCTATSLEAVPLFAALAKIGAAYAPISPALTGQEVERILALARPRLVVADAAHPDLGIDLAALVEHAAGEDAADVDAAELSETDLHTLFFTSGSTGEPKGVPLTHRVNFLRSHPGAQLEPRGVMVCTFPMFHMAAWTIALQQWQARDGVVFVERARAEEICGAVQRHRAARLYCIPVVWRRILDHLELAGTAGEPPDLSSIRFADTGTSATPPELLGAIEAAIPGAYLRVFYGSTEAGNVAALDHPDLRRKPGSCGLPGPAVEVALASDGELLVRGPVVFSGYLDADGAVSADGWYRTGDLAQMDGEGFLSIVGRVRDVIRTGGETVAAADVERALAGHPGLADVAVVGLPDPQWGEVVCAAVVPRAGVAPTLADLRAHCANRLARFAHPRRMEVVEEIPRTESTGQVRRALLTQQLAIR